MAKINIPFNNKDYLIDESSLSAAAAELKSHLLSVMNGSGATITLDGISYNIDSTKLSNARNTFVSHLGTIAGSGSKVNVNGVEYSIDSTKISGAISELSTVLGGLISGGATSGGDTLTWDGNTEGRFCMDAGSGDGALFVHVSDAVPTPDDVVNGRVTDNSGWDYTWSNDNTLDVQWVNGAGILAEGTVMVMPSEEVSLNLLGTVIPNGVYFTKNPDRNYYITSFTINGYTGFPVA